MDETTHTRQQGPHQGDHDDPIPFALTVRARREIAPEQLPDLRVVHGPDGGDLDRAGDPRPAQARALRRSGLTARAIADQLEVDELVVQAWIADTAVLAPRHPHLIPENGVRGGDRRVGPSGSLSDGRPHPDDGNGEDAAAQPEEADVTGALARAAAHRDALDRLGKDPRFAGTVGLAAGLICVEATALSWATSRPQAASRLLEGLREELDLASEHVRIVLRIGPRVAGDLARQRWSRALGVPRERVVHTRWPTAETPDAVQAMLRITGTDAAATVAGWLDAFVDPQSVALELAF